MAKRVATGDGKTADNPKAVPGDNAPSETVALNVNKLRDAVKRVERLMEERADISADISDVSKELRSEGFDTKSLRRIKLDDVVRKEREAMDDLYKHALGMDGEPEGGE